MIVIARDDFEEWLANPVTEALMRGLQRAEAQIEQTWLAVSLDGGVCDAIELSKMRERRTVYREIRAMTNQKLEEMNNDD